MWQNSSTNLNNSSLVISDSDDNATISTRQNILIDSSDNDESISMERESMDLNSSSIIENNVKRNLKKHRLIYSDEESISDIDDKPSYRESESDKTSDDDSELSSTNSSTNFINRKRKDISHDYTKENIKDLKIEDSFDVSNNTVDVSETNESKSLEMDSINKSDDFNEKEEFNTDVQENEQSIVDINSDTDSTPEEKSSEENTLAISYAKQEIGVGNIDPLVAQERALLCCKLQQLKNQLEKTKLLLNTANIEILPDKGKKLQESIIVQEKEIKEVEEKLERTPLVQPFGQMNAKSMSDDKQEETSFLSSNQMKYLQSNSEYFFTDPTESSELKPLGKKALETREREFTLTVERLQDLHGSLVARPSEDAKAEDPPGLKVKLMPHQQHALAWLMWREQKRPPGGVLADDMGLGKTLTMISLIMATLGQEDDNDSDDEWHTTNKSITYKGGTLVVCPASLLSQWENEIKSKCKKGILSVEVYHGNNREKLAKRLAKYDVVITTYNILSREFKTMSTVYKIHWKRAILDEAHVIRNYKSQVSQSVCCLIASKRWALTGTPIQNKEMDLYSLLKFLKCSPFDDIRVWKRWVDNKNAAGHQRLATVMKTLMLRRTKQELQAQGALESLPTKNFEEVEVKLDSQEQLVYEKVLIYSRTLFAQFLSQRAEKDHVADLMSGMYDKPSFLSNPNKNTQFTKAQNKLLSLHADVKTHEILVLLLRLRQICCHPALIHAMLDQNDLEQNEIMDEENIDTDIISRINNISLCENEENEDVNEKETEIGVDHRVTKNILTSKNPVFESDRLSSKIKAVLNMVTQILDKGDKLIIVSQWSSMLEIIGSHLSTIKGATFREFSGKVPIKDRQVIIDSFNDLSGDPKILLLSLTAGGVGLNLVGGNHLLLIDIHWNPQLETQAQDRIYRFGQKKDVFIYKFICKNTIEERIKHLQENKLAISQNVLSGEKNKLVSKLSLNDLKSLFAL